MLKNMILPLNYKPMNNLIKKLALGTAQFGLDYGINNSSGKPPRGEALAMLDLAYEKGIRVFDTADSYGQAEEILGEFTRNRGLGGKIKIITKLKPSPAAGSSTGEAMADQLRQSLKCLKSDYVDGYLLHSPESIRQKETVSALGNFKKQGLVKNIGVSIYEAADAIYAAKLKEIDYIQIPYNIFDQRLDKTDFFKLAKANGVTVFARSAFLQGLLLMPEEKIPNSLAKVKIYLKRLDEILEKHGISRLAAALLFSLNNDNINYVVFGADKIGQMAETIALAEKPIDCRALTAELKSEFDNIEKNIISPSLWKK